MNQGAATDDFYLSHHESDSEEVLKEEDNCEVLPELVLPFDKNDPLHEYLALIERTMQDLGDFEKTISAENL